MQATTARKGKGKKQERLDLENSSEEVTEQVEEAKHSRKQATVAKPKAKKGQMQAAAATEEHEETKQKPRGK